MFLLLAATVVALAVVRPGQAQDRLKVIASFSILADMVREVSGDRAEVAALVGPDTDVHAFQPSPAEAKTLAEAQLVVINGLGFEGGLDRLIRASGYRGPIVTASEGVKALPARRRHDHGRDAGRQPSREAARRSAPDPHAWQDLRNGQIYVENIVEALIRQLPMHADELRTNGRNYVARLQELDRFVRRGIAAIPPEKRQVITSHDAFSYFEAAYEVRFIAAAGVSTEAEPSPRAVARLIDQIKKEKTKAIFVENLGDPRLIRRIADDAGGHVGGKLYSDALSGPGGEASTYEKMFRYNVTKLIEGMTAN
jgi:zinc/manganese transport system substrate-binding protein